jgi:hypothetical protein
MASLVWNSAFLQGLFVQLCGVAAVHAGLGVCCAPKHFSAALHPKTPLREDRRAQVTMLLPSMESIIPSTRWLHLLTVVDVEFGVGAEGEHRGEAT